jgi:outer membrane murein-binding lipoprotein Lpp
MVWPMRTVLFAVAIAVTTLTGCSKAEKSAPAATEDDKLAKLTVDEVDQLLATKSAVPVDCNGDKTRKRMGVVPGAILVSDEEQYAASELPADKTTKLVFYCANPG